MGEKILIQRIYPGKDQNREFSVEARISLLGILFALVFSLFPLGAEETPSLEGNPPAAPSFPNASFPSVSGRPLTFWLLDDHGKWKIPLPNWSISEVSRFFDLTGDHQTVPYTIESLTVHGKVEEHLAYLTALYRIHITGDEPVRIPLGLKEGILFPPTNGGEVYEYEGDGDFHLEIDPDGGYLAVISPQKEADLDPSGDDHQQRHLITLHTIFKVESLSGSESRLSGTFAPAVTSRFRMEVPLPDIQIAVSEGALALSPISLDENSSEIVLNGLTRTGTATQVTWWKRQETQSGAPKILQLENAVITATLDEEQVLYDLNCPIRISGESREVLTFQLPEGAEFIQDSFSATSSVGAVPAYELSRREPDEEHSSPQLDIRFIRSLPETATLRFRLAIPLAFFGEVQEGDEWELGGVSLIGAQKQSGTLFVRFPTEFPFLLTPRNGLRDASAALADKMGEGRDEAFAFYTAPFSLSARPITRKTRTRVESEYQVQVHASEASLKANFHYTVHAAPVRELRLNLNNWVISGIEPENVIDLGSMYTDPKTAEQVLPLLVPATGEIDLHLTASYQFQLRDNHLDLPLPTPVADWIEPGAVVVLSDDNIELVPDPDRICALTSRSTRALKLNLEIPRSTVPALVYQTDRRRADEEYFPQFSASVLFHKREVEILQKTEIQLTEESAANQVIQSWTYHVAYEPLREVTLLVPARMKDSNSLLISINGKPVNPADLSTENLSDSLKEGEKNSVVGSAGKEKSSSRESGGAGVRKKIFIPDSYQIGTFTVSVQYPLGEVKLEKDQSNLVTVDLATSLGGDSFEHQLTIKTRPGIFVELLQNSSSNWQAESHRSPAKGGVQEYHYSSYSAVSTITFNATPRFQDAFGRVTAERVWLQTWLVQEKRFDRLAAKVTSDLDHFTVALPPGVPRSCIEVHLDGKPYSMTDAGESYQPATGELRIALTPEQRKTPVILELSYLIEKEEAETTEKMVLPSFCDDAAWVRRCYWQLILPDTRHIIGQIDGWTREYVDTAWSGLRFSRRSTMGQKDLSLWVGCSTPEEISPRTNVYLFGSFSPAREVEIHFAQRVFLVLIGSGITLLIGLGFLYLPLSRYQGFFLVMIFLILAIFFYRPVIILVFLQTAVFGVLLTLLTALLRWLINSRKETELLTPSQGSPTPGADSPLSSIESTAAVREE